MLRASIGVDPGKKGAMGLIIFEYPTGEIVGGYTVKVGFDTYHPS